MLESTANYHPTHSQRTNYPEDRYWFSSLPIFSDTRKLCYNRRTPNKINCNLIESSGQCRKGAEMTALRKIILSNCERGVIRTSASEPPILSTSNWKWVRANIPIRLQFYYEIRKSCQILMRRVQAYCVTSKITWDIGRPAHALTTVPIEIISWRNPSWVVEIGVVILSIVSQNEIRCKMEMINLPSDPNRDTVVPFCRQGILINHSNQLKFTNCLLPFNVSRPYNKFLQFFSHSFPVRWMEPWTFESKIENHISQTWNCITSFVNVWKTVLWHTLSSSMTIALLSLERKHPNTLWLRLTSFAIFILSGVRRKGAFNWPLRKSTHASHLRVYPRSLIVSHICIESHSSSLIALTPKHQQSYHYYYWLSLPSVGAHTGHPFSGTHETGWDTWANKHIVDGQQ